MSHSGTCGRKLSLRSLKRGNPARGAHGAWKKSMVLSTKEAVLDWRFFGCTPLENERMCPEKRPFHFQRRIVFEASKHHLLGPMLVCEGVPLPHFSYHQFQSTSAKNQEVKDHQNNSPLDLLFKLTLTKAMPSLQKKKYSINSRRRLLGKIISDIIQNQSVFHASPYHTHDKISVTRDWETTRPKIAGG